MTITVAAKIVGIAFAVGLDVLALSIAVGVMRIGWAARIRLGAAFCAAEVLMQVIGYSIGTGAGHVVGTIAIYVGFAVLAAVGGFIFYESFEHRMPRFKPDSPVALLVASVSVSLDSLGIGMSLPGVPLPLLPLLMTVAVSTIMFTAVGLAFGERLGRRYKRIAQRVDGAPKKEAAGNSKRAVWGSGAVRVLDYFVARKHIDDPHIAFPIAAKSDRRAEARKRSYELALRIREYVDNFANVVGNVYKLIRSRFGQHARWAVRSGGCDLPPKRRLRWATSCG